MTDLFELPSAVFAMRFTKAGWDESKHPRDARGRWARGGGVVGALLAPVVARIARMNRRANTKDSILAGRLLTREAVPGGKFKPGGVVERDAARHVQAYVGRPKVRGDLKSMEDHMRSVRLREQRRKWGDPVRPLYTSRGQGKPRKRARRVMRARV